MTDKKSTDDTDEEMTISDIRIAMARGFRLSQAGEISPAIANAGVNQVGMILRTVKMQMDYYRLIGKTPNIPLLLTEAESAA